MRFRRRRGGKGEVGERERGKGEVGERERGMGEAGERERRGRGRGNCSPIMLEVRSTITLRVTQLKRRKDG